MSAHVIIIIIIIITTTSSSSSSSSRYIPGCWRRCRQTLTFEDCFLRLRKHDQLFPVQCAGWLRGTVVERRSLVAGELSRPALDLQLTGDHYCGEIVR